MYFNISSKCELLMIILHEIFKRIVKKPLYFLMFGILFNVSSLIYFYRFHYTNFVYLNGIVVNNIINSLYEGCEFNTYCICTMHFVNILSVCYVHCK